MRGTGAACDANERRLGAGPDHHNGVVIVVRRQVRQKAGPVGAAGPGPEAVVPRLLPAVLTV